jgi:hypothetical protein
MSNYVLSRIYVPDERDYPVSELLAAAPPPQVTQKYWWDSGWWGNQGETSECTAYSWTHWVEDNILNEVYFATLAHPLWNVDQFYNKLKLNDGIPGTNYDGSTVRAGAKVLRELGILEEYRWAKDVNEMATVLLTMGPVVCGTTWYNNMFNPDANGLIKVGGGPAGGHAYVINGVDTVKKLFRIKNSWGQDWGVKGHAFISFDDFAGLMANGGDVCVPLAKKVTSVPVFTTVPDSDVADDPGNPENGQ